MSFPVGKTVLLGPNGAGKSTLMEIVAGVLTPSSGRVEVDETSLSTRGLRRVVGHMPQSVRALRGLTVEQQVAYAGWLGGLGRAASRDGARDVLATVGLTDLADRSASRLSGGQLRRVGLASVLVTQPRVLLLDEPTAGLDPAQRARFRQNLDRLPVDAITVVSTHQLDDVLDVYDYVVVLAGGCVRWQGPPEALVSQLSGTTGREVEDAYLTLVGGEE